MLNLNHDFFEDFFILENNQMLVKLFSVEHLMTIWSFLGRHLVTEKRMRSLKQAGRPLVGITRNKT